MAFVRNPVVYVPDLTNGRPIVDGKVYLLTAGTVPPTQDSAINPADLLTVTYVNEAGNTVTQPQPLYTSKGGCLYGSYPSAAAQYMIDPQGYVFAVYNSAGHLQYSAETTASDYVETDALAAVDSTVLVGGVEAKDLAEKYEENHSIYDFGGVDDWNGTTGTNNLVPLAQYTAFMKSIGGGSMRFPANGTGIYYVDGTDGYEPDIEGIEIEADEGVSFITTGPQTLFVSGIKANRHIIVGNINAGTGLGFNDDISKFQFRKPADVPASLSQMDANYEIPSAVDLALVSGYTLQSSGGRTPTSLTKSGSQVITPNSVGADNYVFAVPAKLGEEISCYTTASGAGCAGVFTPNKWVFVQSDSGTGSLLINDNGTVKGIYSGEILIAERNKFNSALVSVVVTGATTFAVLVNGVSVYSYDAGEPIYAVIFGNRGNTGPVTYNGLCKIKNSKITGSRPLRIVALGDSTSQINYMQGSQYTYMQQFLASAGCQVQLLTNLAVGGQTSGQQRALLEATDINGYDFCYVQVGINDVQTGTSVSTYTANLSAIADYCAASNVQMICGLPTSWYPQSEAAPYGQVGQNTINSSNTAAYRSGAILAMSSKGVPVSTAALKHQGFVGGKWLDTDGADPVLKDNIHPTAYGAMMMGLAAAQTMLGSIRKCGLKKSAPAVIPNRWRSSFTSSQTTLPSVVNDDGDILFIGAISIPSIPANGTEILKLEPEVAPLTFLYFTASCLGGSGPTGVCNIAVAPTGSITVFNVPASTTQIALSGLVIERW